LQDLTPELARLAGRVADFERAGEIAVRGRKPPIHVLRPAEAPIPDPLRA
jgi:hypothetical protein